MRSFRMKGLVVVVVVALHVLVGYVLLTGVVHQEPQTTLKPIDFMVIHEVTTPILAPTPAPIRKVQSSPDRLQPDQPVAPALAAVTAVPVAFNNPVKPSAPTPPSVPSAPSVLAATPLPARSVEPKSIAISLACPQQVPPEMPIRALREGIEGVVRAQIRVSGGRIQSVEILSGPRVFHEAVKAAMLQYICVADGGEVLATQEFKFKFE